MWFRLVFLRRTLLALAASGVLYFFFDVTKMPIADKAFLASFAVKTKC